jgi:hypothetical protein
LKRQQGFPLSDSNISTPALAEARGARAFMLTQQEPYPAIVLDRFETPQDVRLQELLIGWH